MLFSFKMLHTSFYWRTQNVILSYFSMWRSFCDFFREEKERDNKLLEFMNAETEKISFFTHKIFFAFGFIYDEGSEMCSAFYDEEDAKKFPNTSIPSFFFKKKGLSYKNFLNYWLFISSAFYVWEFLRKAVYWRKFMS